MKSQGSHLATNGNTFQCHVPEMLGKDSKLNIFIRGLSSRHFVHGHATMQENKAGLSEKKAGLSKNHDAHSNYVGTMDVHIREI